MFDKRSFLRFAFRAIATGLAIGLLIGFVAVLGFASVWRWPTNAIATVAIAALAYCTGRVDGSERAARIDTITSLPTRGLE